MRSINCNVLEMAPCSVGILADRGLGHRTNNLRAPASGRSSSPSVAAVFLGGKDDREAMTFAKRMIRERKRTSLTVVNLLPGGSVYEDIWDKMPDMEVMKDVKLNNDVGPEAVTWIEKRVKDGPETAVLLRAMAAE